MSRVSRAILGAVTVAAIPAALATAATKVRVLPPIEDQPASVSVSGDKRGNDISVEFRSKRAAFVIEDATAQVRTAAGEPGRRCDRIARHKAVCPLPEPEFFIVAALGNDGDDRIRIRRSIPVSAEIIGDQGDDVLVGAGQGDFFSGGLGSDVLRGRGGNDGVYGSPGRDLVLGGRGDDILDGGEGRDRLEGGPGDDYLVVEEGRNTIDCGDGEDRVVWYSGKARIAKNCERVERL